MEHSSKEVGFLQGRDLQRIHSSTLKVLEETGVRVDEENARKLLDDAGAIVDSKRKIVRVPQNLVEEMIKKARRCGRLFGRNSKNDLSLKKGKFHVMTSSTGVRVLDLDTGAVRPSTKKDVEDSARLADALENFHIYSIMVDALD
ncbi:MAG: trimethylamine methyltransferase family protein, partial [Candidatus Bathyarchaeota archaeon]